jgi:acyl carrier protein
MTATLTSLERLRQCLPRSAAAAAADPAATIECLGFDSLDLVEFLCAVDEEFGLRLTADDLPPGQTLAGLLARIDQTSTTD